jgi:hypothetical protein
MNKRYISWIAIALVFVFIFVMLSGFGDASSYVKDNYSLVDVQGQGKNTAKIYSVEGKDVPTVANELALEETPKEKSKESKDQMFLAYTSKIINLQKDPNNGSNTLVEINSIENAKKNYDSSFLEGYIAASVLQQLLGSSWVNGNRGGSDYKGYTTTQRYDDYGKYQEPAPKKKVPAKSTPAPTTTNRQGSFGTTPSTTAPTAPSTGSNSAAKPATPTTTDTKGSFGTAPSTTTKPPAKSTSSNSSSNVKKNDGSTSTIKAPKSSSKPSTSSRSGSFKKK